MVILSVSPLFLVLVFVGYLFCFVLTLVFLINSYYYSYIIFLLFFRGLLVMFMYVCRIIFNEKLYLRAKLFFFSLIVFCVEVFRGGVNFLALQEGFGIFYYEFCNLLKFFLFSFRIFSVFFVFYLFFCLIVIYEVIKKNSGPLRISL